MENNLNNVSLEGYISRLMFHVLFNTSPAASSAKTARSIRPVWNMYEVRTNGENMAFKHLPFLSNGI